MSLAAPCCIFQANSLLKPVTDGPRHWRFVVSTRIGDHVFVAVVGARVGVKTGKLCIHTTRAAAHRQGQHSDRQAMRKPSLQPSGCESGIGRVSVYGALSERAEGRQPGGNAR